VYFVRVVCVVRGWFEFGIAEGGPFSVHKNRNVWYTIVMKKAARLAVDVKKIFEFVPRIVAVGTVFAPPPPQ
jgi:hypothetical protein